MLIWWQLCIEKYSENGINAAKQKWLVSCFLQKLYFQSDSGQTKTMFELRENVWSKAGQSEHQVLPRPVIGSGMVMWLMSAQSEQVRLNSGTFVWAFGKTDSLFFFWIKMREYGAGATEGSCHHEEIWCQRTEKTRGKQSEMSGWSCGKLTSTKTETTASPWLSSYSNIYM